ncbi:hypothetical protein NDN08_001634 [Rhodosorus marinus]|uniref:Ubiquitin-like domain-containing protein n=1 Tax=Rhodosorus marinus TaxID=101924 RepID=A0AAV8UST9_9RHOD|nr:hypothetical protein NDN08_001634 [Rhodosorus marinus]
MSVFSQREKQVEELHQAVVQVEASVKVQDGETSKKRVDEIHEGTEKLKMAVTGYLKKVAVGKSDPNKKIYGSVMEDRIEKMDKSLKDLDEKLLTVKEDLQVVLEREAVEKAKLEKEENERRIRREDEEKKRREQEELAEQKRKAEEEERVRIESEKKQLALEAKQKAKKEKEKRKLEECAKDTLEADKGKPEGNSVQSMIKLKISGYAGEAVLSADYGPVPTTCNVLSVKEAILNSGVPLWGPVETQRLIYKGHFLENDRSLESYGLSGEDTLYFVKLPDGYVASESKTAPKPMEDVVQGSEEVVSTKAPEGMIRVSLKNRSSTVSYSVEPSWTVAKVKELVHEKEGSNPDDLSLVFQGRVLKNGDVLESSGIKDESVIYSMDKKRTSETANASAVPMDTDTTSKSTAPISSSGAVQSAPASSAPAAPSIRRVPPPSGTIHEVTSGREEFDEILKDCGPTRLCLVDFNASWCGPCRAIAPKLQRLAQENPDISFVGIDSEASAQNMSLFRDLQITSMPTFWFYVNGRQIMSVVGAREASLVQGIQQYRQASGVPAPPAASSASSASSAPPSMTVTVMASLQKLKSSCSEADFITAVRTISTYLSKIVTNQENEKFRKIRIKNPAFEARVNRHPGGIDCLLAFGFKRETADGEEYLIMSEADAKRGELRQVNGDLQAAFQPVLSTSAGANSSTTGSVLVPSQEAPAASENNQSNSEEDAQRLLEEAIRLSLQEDEERENTRDGGGSS